MKKNFPQDIDYLVPLETATVVQVSINEVVTYIVDCIVAGSSGCISVLAKLAGHIDTGIGYPGFTDRYFYFI